MATTVTNSARLMNGAVDRSLCNRVEHDVRWCQSRGWGHDAHILRLRGTFDKRNSRSTRPNSGGAEYCSGDDRITAAATAAAAATQTSSADGKPGHP